MEFRFFCSHLKGANRVWGQSWPLCCTVRAFSHRWVGCNSTLRDVGDACTHHQVMQAGWNMVMFLECMFATFLFRWRKRKHPSDTCVAGVTVSDGQALQMDPSPRR